MSIWCFKKGKREEAFAELDRILSSLSQNVTGFRGYMSLLSKEDLTAAVVLTIWQDEEALEASEKGVFADAIKKVQGLLQITSESILCAKHTRQTHVLLVRKGTNDCRFLESRSLYKQPFIQLELLLCSVISRLQAVAGTTWLQEDRE